MAKYKIAVMPGDGVGKDVTEAAMLVLEKIGLDAEYTFADIGWEFWCKEGNPLPERTVEILKNSDCALFGAITSKPRDEAKNELSPELKDKGFEYFSPIVNLRQMFNLHTNLRPCKAFEGNPLNFRDDIDLVVFRENTEDLYCGVEFRPIPKELNDVLLKYHKKFAKFANLPDGEIAMSLRLNTKKASRSISMRGFDYARKHGYKNVTIVEKPNVVRETSGMMLEQARAVAKEFPEIPLWEANIDAMAMWLVKNPQDYGVLVASNLFGDIISDLAGQLVGGLGFSSSANIGDDFAVFEPTHGSAPKYSGLYKVNPTAMLMCTKLMLDWLGETDKAQDLQNAIAQVIKEGKVRTYDMGGSNTTLEMGQAVASLL